MNPIAPPTENDLDPEEVTEAFQQPKEMPELGKVWTFQGKKLEPYSAGREALFQRLMFEPTTEGEAASLLVFICTQPAERCVMVRGDKEVQKFLVEHSDWMDSIGWMKREKRSELRAEILRIHDEIMADVKTVSAVEPDMKGGTGSGKP